MSFSNQTFSKCLLIGVDSLKFENEIKYYENEINKKYDILKNQGVLISKKDSLSFVAAFLAAAKKNIPIILGNPSWRENEWSDFFQQFSPGLIFGDIQNSSLKTRKININNSEQIIFIPTGGTSSKSLHFAKHTWETLSAQALMVQRLIGGGKVNSICSLPLYHVSGLMQIIRAVVTGGKVFLLNPTNKDLNLRQIVETYSLNLEDFCLSLVPTQLLKYINCTDFVSHAIKLKTIFLGGAACNTDVLNVAADKKLPIVMTYGMTETAGMVFAQDIKNFLNKEFSIGEPLDGVKYEVVIIDGDFRLKLFSGSLFLGYAGQKLIERSKGFLTSDCAIQNISKRLVGVARADSCIISGGEKINLEEIKFCIQEINIVKAVSVIGKASKKWGQELIAYIVLYENLNQDEAKRIIITNLKNKLVRYKIPKNIIFVSSLP